MTAINVEKLTKWKRNAFLAFITA